MDLSVYKDGMEKAIANLKKEFSSLRTGRAHPSMVESIKVDVYGAMMPVSQCGTVSVPESRVLQINVWDAGSVKAVEKALVNANLTPNTEGNIIRITVAELTEEKRIDLKKVASSMAENCKVSIRNVRKDANDAVKKEGVGEDESHDLMDEIQKLTDVKVEEVVSILKEKEKEIMTI